MEPRTLATESLLPLKCVVGDVGSHSKFKQHCARTSCFSENGGGGWLSMKNKVCVAGDQILELYVTVTMTRVPNAGIMYSLSCY